MKLKKINRLKKMIPNGKHLYWCNSCDGTHVSPGIKCDVCGHIDETKKMKCKKNNYIDWKVMEYLDND